MVCYRCGREALELAPLWPYERETYPQIEIVMRLCLHCGLEQNHYGDDEILTPSEAAYKAPPSFVPTGHKGFDGHPWKPERPECVETITGGSFTRHYIGER